MDYFWFDLHQHLWRTHVFRRCVDTPFWTHIFWPSCVHIDKVPLQFGFILFNPKNGGENFLLFKLHWYSWLKPEVCSSLVPVFFVIKMRAPEVWTLSNFIGLDQHYFLHCFDVSLYTERYLTALLFCICLQWKCMVRSWGQRNWGCFQMAKRGDDELRLLGWWRTKFGTWRWYLWRTRLCISQLKWGRGGW